MSVEFSNQLIQRYLTYLQHQHGVVISREQAQIELFNLSEMHAAFSLSLNAKPTAESTAPQLGAGSIRRVKAGAKRRLT